MPVYMLSDTKFCDNMASDLTFLLLAHSLPLHDSGEYLQQKCTRTCSWQQGNCDGP